jgi:GNAT superfamily N-acetyltransferase
VPVGIRDAAGADTPALAGIFRRASLSNPGDAFALGAHPDALTWTAPTDRRARCRVAVPADGGAPLGFATTVADGGALELVDLFVDPDRMRRGVGRRLIADVVDLARSCGCPRVEVDGNPHARAFYEAVGFTAVADVATEFGPGIRMRLDT